MSTRQQRTARSKSSSQNTSTIIALFFVLVLIGLIFYFGFIQVR